MEIQEALGAPTLGYCLQSLEKRSNRGRWSSLSSGLKCNLIISLKSGYLNKDIGHQKLLVEEVFLEHRHSISPYLPCLLWL